jgi:translation initiation factor IF-2
MDYTKVGKVTHFYDKIGVAVLQITDESISVGDKIRIGEFDGGVEQEVESLQVDHQQVKTVEIGGEVALKVNGPVKSGDVVYKASE